jgi:hypothetical protein
MKDPLKPLVLFGIHCFTTLALSFKSPSSQRSNWNDAQTRQDPGVFLSSAKRIYVFATPFSLCESIIKELSKRREFQRLGLTISRDMNETDLWLQVRQGWFTMYDYDVIDPKTRLVLASVKLSSLDGTVARKVAKRFMKQMVKARAGGVPSH